MITIYITQGQAKQRAGRGGRTDPAICFRLYTGRRFLSLRRDTPSQLETGNPEHLALSISSRSKLVDVGDNLVYPFGGGKYFIAAHHFTQIYILVLSAVVPGRAQLEGARQRLRQIGAMLPNSLELSNCGYFLQALPHLTTEQGMMLYNSVIDQCFSEVIYFVF